MPPPPWWLAWVGYVLQGVVAVLARGHARKAAFHWPLARFTMWVAAVDFARHFLEVTRPHHRPLFTLDELTFLSEPVMLLWTIIQVTERRKSRNLLRLAAGGTIVIVLLYPYSAAFWVYALVQALCVGAGWFFFGRAFWQGRCWMGVTEMTVFAYLAAYTVVTLGFYFPNWPSVWSLMMGLNILVLALHMGWEASIRVKSRQEFD